MVGKTTYPRFLPFPGASAPGNLGGTSRIAEPRLKVRKRLFGLCASPLPADGYDDWHPVGEVREIRTKTEEFPNDLL